MEERVGDSFLTVLGERIRELRKDRGWSLETLADKADISKQSIRNAEGGRATQKSLKGLAVAFGVSADILVPVTEHSVIRSDEERRILDSFSMEFGKHRYYVTKSVPWDRFGSEPLWDIEKDVCAVSGNELQDLWCVPRRYRMLEAHQLRFITDGGNARRIHVLDDESADEALIRPFASVLTRHLSLGFDVRVINHLMLLRSGLGVDCSGFAVFGSERAVFFKRDTDIDDKPKAVRTNDGQTVTRTAKCFESLWEQGIDSKEWLILEKIKLTPAENRSVHQEIECVRKIALTPNERKIEKPANRKARGPSGRTAEAKGQAAHKGPKRGETKT